MGPSKEVKERINKLVTIERALSIERYAHFWNTKQNEAYIIGFDAFIHDYRYMLNDGTAAKTDIVRAISNGIEKKWIKKNIDRKCFSKGYKAACTICNDKTSKRKYEVYANLSHELDNFQYSFHVKSAVFLLMEIKNSASSLLLWLKKQEKTNSFDIVRHALSITLGNYKKYLTNFTKNQYKVKEILESIYGLSEQEAVYITFLNKDCPIKELLRDLEGGKRKKKTERAEIISFVMSALAKLE